MRIYENRAVFTTLSTALALNGAETTISVGDTTGWPVPGAGDTAIGAIDIGDQGLVEIFSYTGKTATSFTGVTRGLDGTTQPAHSVGTKVRHVGSAKDIQSIGEHLADTVGAHNASAIAVTPTVNGAGDVQEALTAQAAKTGDMLDWQAVRKATTESVTSSTALQDDDELFFAVGANQTWLFEFVLYVLGSTAGDVQTTLSAPAGAAGTWLAEGPVTTNTDTSTFTMSHKVAYGFDDASARGNGTVGTSEILVRITGSVVNGATAGNVRLRWAQNFSDATATSIRHGSFVTARRIG